MRTMIKYFVLLLSLFLTGCNNEEIKTSHIYIFLDVSSDLNRDESLLNGSIPSILDKMGIDKKNGGLSGGVVKFFLLGNVSRSPFKTVRIEEGSGSLLDERTNKYIRSDEVIEFENELTNSFSEAINFGEWADNNSKIYQQLCRELNVLATQEADEKVIIIYSDMLENSDLFSFYSRQGKSGVSKVRNWVQNDPNLREAIDVLSSDCSFPDLTEIDIRMVSNRDDKNDELINLAEQFWTRLFRIHGAKSVEHGAELLF